MESVSVAFLPEMSIQFDHHVARREYLAACVRGTNILAASTSGAGFKIEQLFPCELFPLFNTHPTIHIRGGKDPSRLQVAEINIYRHGKDVEEFGERQAGKDTKSSQDVD